MKFVFLDTETTGLDAGRHCLLEVGARIFDDKFRDTGQSFHSLITPALAAAADADVYAMDMHVKTGLFQRALDCQNGVGHVEDELLSWLEQAGKLPILSGNSVHFDRGFLRRHMPRVEAVFSHRHLDVSAVRMALWFVNGVDPMTVEKKRVHTTHEDLEETLAELRSYAARLAR